MTMKPTQGWRAIAAVALALALVWAVAVAGHAVTLAREAQSLAALRSAGLGGLDGPALAAKVHRVRVSADALRRLLWPVTRAAALGGGLPRVGPTLAAAAPLLDVAAEAAIAADEAARSFAPLLDPAQPGPLLPTLTTLARQHQPQLLAAQAALRRADEARARIPPNLPGPLQRQVDRLNRYWPPAEVGLAALASAPDLLGADAPATYLLLAQNRDELRATGGFISTVGVVTLDKGALTIKIDNAYAVDNFAAHAYPPPPAPLQTYMGAQLWLFRDANWSPDFPTSAAAVAGLYALGQGKRVNGVIAFDQSALQTLLGALGPVQLPGEAEPVSADNFETFLHAAWTPEVGDLSPEKRVYADGFMHGLGEALLGRVLQSPRDLDFAALAGALEGMLAQKHAAAFVVNPSLAAALAKQGWDGAVRPGAQDYLFVVDSNVGFNKADAALTRAATYRADLSDVAHPTAQLTLTYALSLSPPKPCTQIDDTYGAKGYDDLTLGCYWDYLRVLTPAGAVLLKSAALPTPGQWMWNALPQPGTAAQTIGDRGTVELNQFFVTPAGGKIETQFSYSLPPSALRREGSAWVYRLRWQKQLGASALAARVAITLPPGAELLHAAPAPTTTEGQTLTFEWSLTQDVTLEVAFRAR